MRDPGVSWRRWSTRAAGGRPAEFDARGPAGALEGAPVVSFASNDYLGLSAHPAVVAAAHEALDRWGAGAGASRLVTGSRPVHTELERALADWKGTEAAVCFPTGFAANLGVLSVLGGPGVRVLSDELNHASIIDGCRLSRSECPSTATATWRISRSCWPSRCGRPRRHPTIVVTDTVFSMDGDAAPVEELAALCRRHGALSCSTRPTPSSARTSSATELTGPAASDGRTGERSCAWARCPRRWARSAASWRRPRDVVDLLVNRARPTSSRPALPRPTPPPPWPRSACCAPPEGVRSSARLADLIDRHCRRPGSAAPGHPEPDHPGRPGSEQAALEPRRRCSRPDSGCRPSARRPCRPAPAGSGSTLSAAHDDDVDGRGDWCARRLRCLIRRTRCGADPLTVGCVRTPLVAVVGTGTDVGKTWVSARLLGDLRRRAAASPPASRRSPSTLRRPGRLTTAAVLGAASGEEPETVCPPHRWYEVAMAPPMAAEALGRPPSRLDDLVEELAWPETPVDVGLSRRPAACAHRSPTTATASPWSSRRCPTSCCWWPTPGWARSTRSAWRSTSLHLSKFRSSSS